MRIVTLSDHIDAPSGFGTHHKVVANALAEAGFDVWALGLWDTGAARKTRSGVQTLPMGSRGVPDVVAKLKGMLEMIQPDVLVSLGDPWMFPPLFEAEARDFKWLNWWPVDGGGYPTDPEEQVRLMKPDMVVFMSQFGEREHRRHFGGKVKMTNIPHGVDTRVFKPVTAKRKTALRRFWSDRLKGIDLMAFKWVLVNWDTNAWRKNSPAMLQMMQHLPDDVCLVLHCSEQARPGSGGWDLAGLAKRYGVAGRVAFTGRGRAEPNVRLAVSQEKLATLVQMADVRVSTTTGEGFGIPTIEAMACGVPVVIPGNTTAEELVGVGATAGGLIALCGDGVVQPGTWIERFYVDTVEMAGLTRRLLVDGTLYGQCSRGGVKRVRRSYTTEIVGKMWVDLVNETVKA